MYDDLKDKVALVTGSGKRTGIGFAIARKLAALDCTTVVQDGSDGINATFHVRDFERVAELMKPRRRRRMTEEQRRAAAERLAKYAFKPARQTDSEALIHASRVPAV